MWSIIMSANPMRTCPHCGHLIPSSQSVCIYCGKDETGETSTAATVSKPDESVDGKWVCGKCDTEYDHKVERCEKCHQDSMYFRPKKTSELAKELWICNKCRFVNAADFTKCPKCGSEDINYQSKEKSKRNAITGYVGAVIFIISMIYIAITLATADHTKKVDSVDIWAMSTVYVKKIIKAPSTAKFPHDNIEVRVMPDKSYMVEAYVDSQNSFGAMIRTRYICNLSYDPSADRWKLINIALDE